MCKYGSQGAIFSYCNIMKVMFNYQDCIYKVLFWEGNSGKGTV